MPSACIETGRSFLEERRSNLTLLRQPLQTLLLFFIATAKWVQSRARGAMHNALVRKVLVPCAIVLVLISRFVVPSYTSHVFSVLDRDGDGYITKSEVEHYYVNVLRFPLGTGEAVMSSMRPFASSGGGKVDPRGFAQWWYRTGDQDRFRQPALFPHNYWREVEFALADVLYWLALGILSSVGLGTGIHSGILFLFPHIYLVCAAAQSCGSLNFWSYPANFFYGPRERLFVCVGAAGGRESVALWQVVLKVVPACVCWGAGTAFGEIPPYALSYAAALQSRASGRASGEKKKAKSDGEREGPATSRYDVLSRMKEWTMDKIERYGFWAILLLAAWPNMAFDLCGMACGQFLMPFWTFFGATFIGKALIKVNLQAAFFVVLFSGDRIERAVRWVGDGVSAVAPEGSVVAAGVEKAIGSIGKARESIASRARGGDSSGRGSDAQKGGKEPLLAQLFEWVVLVVILLFFKSIIEAFAAGEQQSRDEQTLERLEQLLSERQLRDAELDDAAVRQLVIDAEQHERHLLLSRWNLPVGLGHVLAVLTVWSYFYVGSGCLAWCFSSLLFQHLLCRLMEGNVSSQRLLLVRLCLLIATILSIDD